MSELAKTHSALRRDAGSSLEKRMLARRQVDTAKLALGKRGAVWWSDGAPDYTRHMAVNTPYREWFESLP